MPKIFASAEDGCHILPAGEVVQHKDQHLQFKVTTNSNTVVGEVLKDKAPIPLNKLDLTEFSFTIAFDGQDHAVLARGKKLESPKAAAPKKPATEKKPAAEPAVLAESEPATAAAAPSAEPTQAAQPAPAQPTPATQPSQPESAPPADAGTTAPAVAPTTQPAAPRRSRRRQSQPAADAGTPSVQPAQAAQPAQPTPATQPSQPESAPPAQRPRDRQLFKTAFRYVALAVLITLGLALVAGLITATAIGVAKFWPSFGNGQNDTAVHGGGNIKPAVVLPKLDFSQDDKGNIKYHYEGEKVDFERTMPTSQPAATQPATQPAPTTQPSGATPTSDVPGEDTKWFATWPSAPIVRARPDR